MKPTCWMKQVGFCLVAMGVLAGMAQADPIGTANVPQILSPRPHNNASDFDQRTFLTTDPILITATYYDPLPACDNVAPTFVQFFVFTSEGRFINQFSGTSSDEGPSTKKRDLLITLAAGTLPAGTFKYTFLVRNCTNAISVVLPELPTIRVFAP
jgi:hypothetical protein